MVRKSIGRPRAVLSNAESLRFWPDRTAPGAPMNVSPCWGWICENSPVPSVCVPGANQYVVFGLRDESAKSALLPAGTVTAPAGAEDGPFSIAELPQICAGGSPGAEPGGGGGVGEDVPVGVGPGVVGAGVGVAEFVGAGDGDVGVGAGRGRQW